MRKMAFVILGTAFTALAACQGDPANQGVAADAPKDAIEAVGNDFPDTSSNFSDDRTDNAADAVEDTDTPALSSPKYRSPAPRPMERQNPGDWNRQKNKTKPKSP
jgi:hypothetical protein